LQSLTTPKLPEGLCEGSSALLELRYRNSSTHTPSRDKLCSGEQLEIQTAGERIYVPVRARCTIEHERGEGSEEIEFQITWDV